MKIAIISPFYKPSVGGVEYIAYHTARELVKRGYEVHVITTTCDNKWKRIAESSTIIEEGVAVHRLEPSFIKIGYATFMKGLKETLKKIRPDIVHCHNLHPHLFQAMKWKDKLKYKLVAQLHFPVATGIDHLPAKLLYRFTMRELVKNQHRIDAFIAHSNTEKQWLISEGIESNKIHIIRFPCIPDELFEYKPRMDIHDILETEIVITYISRIHSRKGQHLLIEAVKHLKDYLGDFRVYIAGPVSDYKYLIYLRNLIDCRGLLHKIVLEPRLLSEEEKLDAIASSDVFAFTSTHDASPVIVLEALALRTPVVATVVGTIPEMLDYREEFLIPELSSSIIARKIAFVLMNKDKVCQLWDFVHRHRASTLISEIVKIIYTIP